jgi:hypothetical protein
VILARRAGALVLAAAAATGPAAVASAQPAPVRAPVVPYHPPMLRMPSPPTARAIGARPSPTPVPAPSAPAAPRYLIEVLTFGPGDHPFTRFGHDAIRVVDRVAGQDLVFNFGTFSIAGPHLIRDFLRGRLRYWLSFAPTDEVVEDYRFENRSVEAQGLALSPEQAAELVRRLQVNALPQNRAYQYDYFRDNCATRVRDVLDAVTGGAVRAAGARPAAETLRGQALRMAADDVPFYLALSIVLGPAADRPIDAWAEDFLPQMLQRTLRLARVADGGPPRPLVANERVVFAAKRPLPRPAPPRWGWRFFGAGVLAGLLFLMLGRLGRRSGLARVVLGALLSFTGAAVGFVGSFLLGSWLFTPHAVVYRNQNILTLAPFALGLAVLGWGVAFGWRGAIRKSFFLAAAGLAFALLAILVKPMLAHQQNGALIAFALPMWLGITLGTRQLLLKTRAAPST